MRGDLVQFYEDMWDIDKVHGHSLNQGRSETRSEKGSIHWGPGRLLHTEGLGYVEQVAKISVEMDII